MCHQSQSKWNKSNTSFISHLYDIISRYLYISPGLDENQVILVPEKDYRDDKYSDMLFWEHKGPIPYKSRVNPLLEDVYQKEGYYMDSRILINKEGTILSKDVMKTREVFVKLSLDM